MNSKILIVVIVVVLAIGGFYFINKSDEEGVMEEIQTEESKDTVSLGMPVPEFDGAVDEMIVEDGGHMGTSYAGEILTSGNAGIVLDFNELDYKEAIASDKLVVLYFYANWCPTCKIEFPKMTSAFEGFDPDEVIGFRVNFKDSDTDKFEESLAKEFGVAYQHTKVFVKEGERILKAPDSWDEGRYISEVNKAI